MIDGNPEFSDLVYDFIKSKEPSASKFYNSRFDDVEIFIDGVIVCTVYKNGLYGRDAHNPTLATDPELFVKMTHMCENFDSRRRLRFS